MNTNSINLRAIESTDIDNLYRWENDDRVWFSSNITRPLSRQTLQLYIDSISDIYADKQVRLIIENEGVSVGCIDLYDFEPLHQRAGVGIMIDINFEEKGFASAALKEIKNYAFNQLGIHQLFCNIASNNKKSIQLFTNNGFEITGTKKDWLRMEKKWIDELTLQCFNR